MNSSSFPHCLPLVPANFGDVRPLLPPREPMFIHPCICSTASLFCLACPMKIDSNLGSTHFPSPAPPPANERPELFTDLMRTLMNTDFEQNHSFPALSVSRTKTRLPSPCGGSTNCGADRKSIMRMFMQSTSAKEQLDLIELMKDENHFFSRLWDSQNGDSLDFVTSGSLCGRCKPFYMQKFRSMLYCYRILCGGDISRMISIHSGRFKNGKFVAAKFKNKCYHSCMD
jgi:hypothetical protein